jgi:hypothetical protein
MEPEIQVWKATIYIGTRSYMGRLTEGMVRQLLMRAGLSWPNVSVERGIIEVSDVEEETHP